MAKIAFLFPGQGSQFAGMGKTLAENYPAARAIFEEADTALGFPLSQLCFDGPEEELKKTENTQPALLTVSVAAHEVLREHGIEANFVAGHSLGEYSALVAAGAIRFTDAVRLVRQRGRYMQEAVPQGVGAMAALLKLPEGTLDGILAEAAAGEIVSAANLNSPDQVVIAGHAGAVARAMELAKAAGAKRVVPLPVSAPFHCALMQPAQQRLAVDLAATDFADLTLPLVQNVTAALTTSGAATRTGLIDQVPGTVRWTESIRLLIAEGVTHWVEVGAGGVLSGLLKNIDGNHKAVRFGEAAELEAVKAYLA
jgi:[acyl-carrier-protein] S-malonyltransferase